MSELERLREAMRGLRDAAIKVVTDNPGTVVYYDPIAVADAIDAILIGGDTSATDQAAMARAERLFKVIQSGNFRITMVSASVRKP